MTHGVLRLNRLNTEVTLSPEEIRALQREFRDRHHLHLRGLVSPELVSVILPHLEAGQFKDAAYEDVGTDLRMASNAALDGLHLAANDPVFLRSIQTIADTEPLEVFAGRVYRMVPGAGHSTDWHDDLFGDRHIGLSINFSRQPYQDGVFQLREAGHVELLGQVHNTGLGDAILFRLSKSLEHRVTDVSGTIPKTAFAGWFRTGLSAARR